MAIKYLPTFSIFLPSKCYPIGIFGKKKHTTWQPLLGLAKIPVKYKATSAAANNNKSVNC
jgi:hypothetical protein